MMNSSPERLVLPTPAHASADPTSSLRALRRAWAADLYRYEGSRGAALLIKHLLLSPGFTFTFYLRLCQYLRAQSGALRPLYWLCRVILRHYSYKFGIFIPVEAQIGAGFYIGHCGDIHFNKQAIVGRHCNISQGVTLGQANRGRNKGSPVIGDGVYIGPGAKIVGAVRVGNDVAIGANCVVTSDVPDHGVAVGIPGRVISFEGARGYVEYTDDTLSS